MQWRIHKIVLGEGGAKGVWDGVDTSPDLGVKMSSKPSKWMFDITGGRHERN